MKHGHAFASSLTFRRAAVMIAATLLLGAAATADESGTAIRPFRVAIPDAKLADLRRRIAATNWPEGETVRDSTQGVQLATMQKLARYWETDYDWRKAEARLNAYPQFMTSIDGLDIHFIHVRSKQPNALPVSRMDGLAPSSSS